MHVQPDSRSQCPNSICHANCTMSILNGTSLSIKIQNFLTFVRILLVVAIHRRRHRRAFRQCGRENLVRG
jgi:hypothetical protein